jgi:hypothetical protein
MVLSLVFPGLIFNPFSGKSFRGMILETTTNSGKILFNQFAQVYFTGQIFYVKFIFASE